MATFISSLMDHGLGRTLQIDSPAPIIGTWVESEDTMTGDISLRVYASESLTFVGVVHADDSVTKPLAAADYTITVTR
jgi:hypothetical protein